MKLNGSASESLQNNYQKIDAENVVSLTPKLKETRLLDGWVAWIEQRPNAVSYTHLTLPTTPYV